MNTDSSTESWKTPGHELWVPEGSCIPEDRKVGSLDCGGGLTCRSEPLGGVGRAAAMAGAL